MLRIAKERNWQLDQAELQYPILLHQRISTIIAREYFKIDNDKILQAINYHTTFKAALIKMEMIIFIVDKLAWDQPALTISLEEALLSVF